MTRIVEAYVGEYASGKSENAVNRAIQLARSKRKVTLADLDIVEPFYTLGSIKYDLEALGINVAAWETKETFGLGETGTIIKPEMRWVLRRAGDVILDIGYGVEGAKTLNLIEEIVDNPDLKIYFVVNIARPMTMTEEDILGEIAKMGVIHGLINNSHLGEETAVEFIQKGAVIVARAAERLNLPVIATSIEERFAEEIGTKDCMGNPVRTLRRYLAKSFW